MSSIMKIQKLGSQIVGYPERFLTDGMYGDVWTNLVLPWNILQQNTCGLQRITHWNCTYGNYIIAFKPMKTTNCISGLTPLESATHTIWPHWGACSEGWRWMHWVLFSQGHSIKSGALTCRCSTSVPLIPHMIWHMFPMIVILSIHIKFQFIPHSCMQRIYRLQIATPCVSFWEYFGRSLHRGHVRWWRDLWSSAAAKGSSAPAKWIDYVQMCFVCSEQLFLFSNQLKVEPK